MWNTFRLNIRIVDFMVCFFLKKITTCILFKNLHFFPQNDLTFIKFFIGATFIVIINHCFYFEGQSVHTSTPLPARGSNLLSAKRRSGTLALLIRPIGASTKPEFLLSYLMSLLWSRSPGPGPAFSILGMLMRCLSDGLLLKIEIYGRVRQCSL